MPPFHHHHRRKEKYAYADVQTQSISLQQLMHTVAINAQAQTNALRIIQIEISMGRILTRYWYFIEQNEM